MAKLYSTVYKSVVRAVNDLVKDIQATMPTLNAQYWAWESRDDEDQLPRAVLIGVNGFSFQENNTLWLIRLGISISTVDDANLLVEADVIDKIHDVFGEKMKIPLRDPENGDQTNELVSIDFDVLPMVQTQLRNYRTIGIELRRTGT